MIGNLNDYAVILDSIRKKLQPKVSAKIVKDYLAFCHKQTTDERTMTDVGVTGLSMAEFVSDGGIGSFDSPIQGFVKTYTQGQAQKNAALSFQTYFFLIKKGDKQGVTKKVAKMIMDIEKSFEDLKSYFGQSLLQQGFGTSFSFQPLGVGVPTVVSTVAADGQSYWDQNHLIEDGSGVFSTVIVDGVTPSPVLSMSAIEAAHRLQGLKTDGRGISLDTELDCVVVRRNTVAHQEAKRIKSDLDKGHYPATTPGTNGSFMEAPRVGSFEIIALRPFPTGTSGLDGLSWGMFDKKMMNEDYGFQYIEALPTQIERIPGQLNRDYVIGGDSLFVFGATDVRPWMWSAGDGATT